jgi:hypothetical protein
MNLIAGVSFFLGLLASHTAVVSDLPERDSSTHRRRDILRRRLWQRLIVFCDVALCSLVDGDGGSKLL